MVVGVEREKYACGHEMSNQQSVKARSSPTETWIALGKLVATYNFTASLHDLYLGSCAKVVILELLPLL